LDESLDEALGNQRQQGQGDQEEEVLLQLEEKESVVQWLWLLKQLSIFNLNIFSDILYPVELMQLPEGTPLKCPLRFVLPIQVEIGYLLLWQWWRI
jgi:hypothetical protein